MQPVSDLNNSDDQELIDAISRRNEKAFQILVVRHTQRFFKLAVLTLQNVGDAEDVVQSAFMKLWQNPLAFDSAKSKFTTWFYKVVINLCRDKIKQKRNSDDNVSAYIAYTAMSSPQSYAGEDLHLERHQGVLEQQVALEYAIARLASRQREALNLVFYAHLPQTEAAQIMGISLKALESVLHRAKKQLSQDIGRYMSDHVLGKGQSEYKPQCSDGNSKQRSSTQSDCESSSQLPYGQHSHEATKVSN